MLEIEIKLHLGTEVRARDVCTSLGLPWLDGVYEKNRIYDFPDGRLKRRGALVRLRERGGSGFLTYKEKSQKQVPGAKVRLEYESAVSDTASVDSVLTSLGLVEVMTYERYRTRHSVGSAHLEMDFMPGGWFCEIEGSPEAIEHVRQAAGLGSVTPVVWSYPRIFRELCSAMPQPPRDWTFAALTGNFFSLPPTGDPFWSRAARER